MQIRHKQNFLFGLFLILLGGGALIFGRDLQVGSALRMGPGYFPSVLAGCILVFGLGFLITGFVADGPEWERVAWRPLAIVIGTVILFALVIRTAGLALTILGVVIVASLASSERRLLETILFAGGLALGCVVIFRIILSLNIPTWPQW